MITLVLGGARSGKSALGERLVLTHPGEVLYLATALVDDDDGDFAGRVDRHRRHRDPRFTTIECGADLADALIHDPTEPALVDALGTWLAHPDMIARWSGHSATPELLSQHDRTDGSQDDPLPADPMTGAIDDLVAALTGRAGPTVVISDEVGLGVHPEMEIGRRFRDAIGTVNQAVAAVADDVLLMVAGRVMRLERPDALGLRLAPPSGPR